MSKISGNATGRIVLLVSDLSDSVVRQRGKTTLAWFDRTTCKRLQSVSSPRVLMASAIKDVVTEGVAFVYVKESMDALHYATKFQELSATLGMDTEVAVFTPKTLPASVKAMIKSSPRRAFCLDRELGAFDIEGGDLGLGVLAQTRRIESPHEDSISA